MEGACNSLLPMSFSGHAYFSMKDVLPRTRPIVFKRIVHDHDKLFRKSLKVIFV